MTNEYQALCDTFEELLDAIDSLRKNAEFFGDHPSAVHLKQPLQLTLQEETLSDGSTVRNIDLKLMA